MKEKSFLKNSSLLIIALFLFTSGCEQKKEQEELSTPKDTTAVSDTAAVTPQLTLKDTMNLTGTWNGIFDQRAATLNITDQDSNSFKGEIKINYRNPVNQEITGSFDPFKKTFKMKDELHNRNMGQYSGKLSEDLKGLSGKFTKGVDGSIYNFNFTKK